MIGKKKKSDSKSLASQKRNRRKLLSFFRVIRYGTDSFIRNSWLSIAATAVMTITLLIIFTAFVAQNILTDTIGDLRSKVKMSIYLQTDTTDQVGSDLSTELKKLSSVRAVTYISAEVAQTQDALNHQDDASFLEAQNAATNKYPATLSVEVNDISNTSQLENFVNTNAMVKKSLNPDHKPSFAGVRRNTIESIGRAVSFAQKVGLAAGAVFIFISSLIIFNTIRMAIFNRKEEIQMMKLIGADKSFIRGPFLVESMMYGFLAALVATGLGIWVLYNVSSTLTSYQIKVQPTIDLVTIYAWPVLLVMIATGSIIGVISSLLATYRYLK
ncbi:MAG: permease-like cell division protein FtsX [Candidatus Saccharibacteria bacterium]